MVLLRRIDCSFLLFEDNAAVVELIDSAARPSRRRAAISCMSISSISIT